MEQLQADLQRLKEEIKDLMSMTTSWVNTLQTH